MEHEVEPVRLRSADTVWVRPIRGDDAVELQRAFALLSDLSRYRRFLSGTPSLTDQQASYFSDVDHDRHEALVALPAERSTDIVGVARFVRYPAASTDADLAITVADDWHRRGLGTALLRLLSERARAVGIRRFTVDMLADNDAVLALMRGAGGSGEVVEGKVVTAHIALEPVAVPVSADALLRAAACRSVVAVPTPFAEAVPELGPTTRAVVALED